MIERAAWYFLALVHAAPALALFAPSLLTRFYDVHPADRLFLLMQHRSALFLAMVVACIWCAIEPGPRKLCAIIMALSMLSFLALYFANGSPAGLKQIAMTDLIGIPALAFVAWKAYAY